MGTRKCAYQQVSNVSFSEDFAHVIIEWTRKQFI